MDSNLNIFYIDIIQNNSLWSIIMAYLDKKFDCSAKKWTKTD